MANRFSRTAALLLVGVVAVTTLAEDPKRIVVATHDVARMSFERPDGYRDGREIRVVRYVLGQLGYDEDSIEFLPVGVDEKFDSVVSSQARLFVGAATLTAQREEWGDFSTPHLSVPYGAAVLIHSPGWWDQLGRAFQRTIGWLMHPRFWIIVLALMLYLRLKALIVATIEKFETHSTEPFRMLLRKTIWWMECTFCNFNADAQDFVPKGYIARRVATALTVLLIIVGVNFIQEGMSNVMHSLPERVTQECRLPGLHVGTKAGTTSVDFLHEMGASVAPYPTVEEALDALVGEELEAVVYDGITLRALISRRLAPRGAEIAYVADFGGQHYGAFFADGDPMLEEWNRIVLSIPAPLAADWDRMFLR